VYWVEIHRRMSQIFEVFLVWQDITDDLLKDFLRLPNPW
jgi:hypothetical protein